MKALLYIVILLVASGCSYSASTYARSLDRAQSLLEEDPAKALEKLNGVNVESRLKC
ncbi:MAG: hypothetical protein NC193_10160 [bacterium]|nr:hypothetical protein [bacterium]